MFAVSTKSRSVLSLFIPCLKQCTRGRKRANKGGEIIFVTQVGNPITIGKRARTSEKREGRINKKEVEKDKKEKDNKKTTLCTQPLQSDCVEMCFAKKKRDSSRSRKRLPKSLLVVVASRKILSFFRLAFASKVRKKIL